MIRVKVAAEGRIYRVSFDPVDDTVTRIERYSRHVLSCYIRDGERHMAMSPTDKPVFIPAWVRGGRALGPKLHRVVMRARSLRAQGKDTELHEASNLQQFQNRLPMAVERELQDMKKQGLSFL